MHRMPCCLKSWHSNRALQFLWKYFKVHSEPHCVSSRLLVHVVHVPLQVKWFRKKYQRVERARVHRRRRDSGKNYETWQADNLPACLCRGRIKGGGRQEQMLTQHIFRVMEFSEKRTKMIEAEKRLNESETGNIKKGLTSINS